MSGGSTAKLNGLLGRVLPSAAPGLLGLVLRRGAIMLGARILGMLLGAAGTIWAARCLGPAQLGLSGLIGSVAAQVIVALSIMHQTVLIREYKEASDPHAREDLLGAATTFFALGAVVTAVAVGVLVAAGAVEAPYAGLSGFLVATVFATALQPIWLFQAAERQHFQSIIAVVQPALQGAIYWFFFRPGMAAADDLAVTTSVSALVAVLYWIALVRLRIITRPPVSLAHVRRIGGLLARSRWYFMLNVSVYVYTMLELPLVGWLRSVPEMGQYRTAFTLTLAAKSLFEIVPMVLYPRFLEWRRTSEELLWSRQKMLAAVFVPLACIGSVAALVAMPPIYQLLYGPVFAAAAIPCAILIISKLVVIVNGLFFWGLATDPAFDRRLSIGMMTTAILSLGADALLIPSFGMWAAALVDLASEVLILAICLGLARTRIRRLRAAADGGEDA